MGIVRARDDSCNNADHRHGGASASHAGRGHRGSRPPTHRPRRETDPGGRARERGPRGDRDVRPHARRVRGRGAGRSSRSRIGTGAGTAAASRHRTLPARLPVEETARCPAQAVRRTSKRSCSSSRATTPGEVVQLALDGVDGRDRLLVRRPVVRALEALPPRRLLGLGMCRTRSFATRPSDITVQRAPIHVARTVSPRSYLEQPAGRSTPPRARSSQKAHRARSRSGNWGIRAHIAEIGATRGSATALVSVPDRAPPGPGCRRAIRPSPGRRRSR